MNIFQNELQKIIGKTEFLYDKRFSGNVLIGKLSENTIAKIHFDTTDVHERYDAIKVSVINKYDGLVDSTLIRFLHEMKKNDRGYPYICRDCDKYLWRCGTPTEADYRALRKCLNNYLEMFSDVTLAQDAGMKMGM